jgi:hypothetical protein
LLYSRPLPFGGGRRLLAPSIEQGGQTLVGRRCSLVEMGHTKVGGSAMSGI